jgi:serine protease Do
VSELLLSALIVAATLTFPTAQFQQPCQEGEWHLAEVAQVFPRATADNAGFLGVRLLDIEPDRAKGLKLNQERAVEIKAVMEGSPADKAGIQPGDVVLSYNGDGILSAQQLSRLVQETPPGRTVKVQYWRNGKTQMAAVVIGTAPATEASPFGGMPNWQMLDFPSPMLIWRNPVIGLEFESLDSPLAEYFGVKGGILVRAVQRDSAAEKAGLRPGDVIFSVGQQTFSSEREFASLLRRGSSVPVSVMRDHKHVELTLSVP